MAEFGEDTTAILTALKEVLGNTSKTVEQYTAPTAPIPQQTSEVSPVQQETVVLEPQEQSLPQVEPVLEEDTNSDTTVLLDEIKRQKLDSEQIENKLTEVTTTLHNLNEQIRTIPIPDSDSEQTVSTDNSNIDQLSQQIDAVYKEQQSLISLKDESAERLQHTQNLLEEIKNTQQDNYKNIQDELIEVTSSLNNDSSTKEEKILEPETVSIEPKDERLDINSIQEDFRLIDNEQVKEVQSIESIKEQLDINKLVPEDTTIKNEDVTPESVEEINIQPELIIPTVESASLQDIEEILTPIDNQQSNQEEVTPQGPPKLEIPTELIPTETYTAAEEIDESKEQNILNNTEATLTALDDLGKAIITLAEMSSKQQVAIAQQQPPPQMPPPPSSASTPGISDLEATSNLGMIPGIRSKFIYQ